MPICALTVANDATTIRLLQQLLSNASVKMILKDTLHLAADYLESETLPQLVILDLSLQGSTAQFLRELRASKRFAEVPVLVIVPEPDADAIKTALQAGANRYLTTSFIQTNLLRTLREMGITARKS